MLRAIATTLLSLFIVTAAAAQEAVWVQVEAQPTLRAAQDRVRAYDAALDNVAGYYLGSGWYGIVLGPYAPADAERLLQSLRARGDIPRDSFIAFGNNFRQQFWPVGVAAPGVPQPLPEGEAGAETVAPEVTAEAAAPVVVVPQIALPDETPREARASEALLDRAGREELQVALQWAGFYDAAIDGAFGRGTRAAMEAWQGANNHEPTGVLTTGQRAELLAAYNAVLDGMGMARVQDDAAGISIEMPTGVVSFAEYEPPFARYGPKGDLPAQVLLISQPGDQARLNGLYEILQTLEVVPVEGERTRDGRRFVIEGANDEIRSFTRVTLANGLIKGFMLVWPAGDDTRFVRIRDIMDASFQRTEGVLDPAVVQPDDDQAIDLIAGLAVRKPQLARSGFFIGRDGTVLTTAEAVAQCERVTIGEGQDAEVIHRDESRGLAVLRPAARLAPIAVASFQTGVPRLQSEVAVAGFPYGGLLVTPSLTFGRLADLRGLAGEEEIKRLAIAAQPGDAGGPVFDNGGAVLGMLLPRNAAEGRQLPEDVGFSVDVAAIRSSLDGAGIAVETTDTLAALAAETLTRRAADMTVLVSCW